MNSKEGPAQSIAEIACLGAIVGLFFPPLGGFILFMVVPFLCLTGAVISVTPPPAEPEPESYPGEFDDMLDQVRPRVMRARRKEHFKKQAAERRKKFWFNLIAATLSICVAVPIITAIFLFYVK